MKTIKVKFCDFYDGFNYQNNQFIDVLSKKYKLSFCDEPEYIIYSCFGTDHLKYNGIRIFYTGECITPNFNECDYAIGFDHLQFGDRFIRIPLYALFQYDFSYKKLIQPRSFSIDDIRRKNGFCSFVYSNCFAQDIRTQMFELLSKYKQVSSGGRYRNNIGGAVKDKEEFQRKHKFSIAFENTSYDGYATEKLMEAFVAGTVPIYYGDPRISDDFNSEAFINVRDYSDLDDVVEYIKYLDNDDESYLKILNTAPLREDQFIDGEKELSTFLYYIFDQKYDAAFRRPTSQTAIAIEGSIRRHSWYESHVYKNYKKVKNQIVRLKTGTLITTKRER